MTSDRTATSHAEESQCNAHCTEESHLQHCILQPTPNGRRHGPSTRIVPVERPSDCHSISDVQSLRPPIILFKATHAVRRDRLPAPSVRRAPCHAPDVPPGRRHCRTRRTPKTRRPRCRTRGTCYCARAGDGAVSLSHPALADRGQGGRERVEGQHAPEHGAVGEDGRLAPCLALGPGVAVEGPGHLRDKVRVSWSLKKRRRVGFTVTL